MRAMTMAWELRREKEGVARRHEVENQLRKLESLPTEPARSRQVKMLRQELAGGMTLQLPITLPRFARAGARS